MINSVFCAFCERKNVMKRCHNTQAINTKSLSLCSLLIAAVSPLPSCTVFNTELFHYFQQQTSI